MYGALHVRRTNFGSEKDFVVPLGSTRGAARVNSTPVCVGGVISFTFLPFSVPAPPALVALSTLGVEWFVFPRR